MLAKLLLPTAGKKRVYNLQSKQIVKVLSAVSSSLLTHIFADCSYIHYVLLPAKPHTFTILH